MPMSYVLEYLSVAALTPTWTASFWPFAVDDSQDGRESDPAGARNVSFELDEDEFDSWVRKHIIIWLLFVCIYLVSFWTIKQLKMKPDNDELYAGDEDFHVYRISLWMCSCSLATSIGAVTLLPFSIIGSEVLQLYPDNYYLQWLNWSLINSMWAYIFSLSNLALFFLLPFAYFFLESQGLSFNRHRHEIGSLPSISITKSVKSRIVETTIVCFLVLVLLVVLADVIFSLNKNSISFSLFNLSIPLVYSLVSMIGTVILLVSTPLGFSKMFDVCGELLITPKVLPKQPEEDVIRLERLAEYRRAGRLLGSAPACCLGAGDADIAMRLKSIVAPKKFPIVSRVFRRVANAFDLLKYPVIILVLLALTIISVSMVVVNSLQLLFGFRALPEYVQYVELRSRHTFGIIGAIVETFILIYIAIASLVGIYSMPYLSTHRPRKGTTSMTAIIGNCALILMVSSALPVLARTLGITSFDLLGAYGRINWISNFTLVMGYNVFFATFSILSLVNKFTTPVRRELARRLWAVTRRDSMAFSSPRPNLNTSGTSHNKVD
uniref:Protein LMBR1L n=1 Tax=Panagrellus redivivus TaxID=6233 RepID=A0A7E4ZWU1_PANRE